MFVDYQPIPVSEARALAIRYRKDFVIILAFDGGNELLHTATFGIDRPSSFLAARLGELATKAIGFDLERKTSYEELRNRTEGTYEEER